MLPPADLSTITERARRILTELPPGVGLVAAAKTRAPEDVLAAVAGGVQIIGHNYVQEAAGMMAELEGRLPPGLRWHMIGHLQRNKAQSAARCFDAIETVDSLALARRLDGTCAAIGKTMPILLEVNSAREPNKAGVVPEAAEGLAREIAALAHLRLVGLMTMGPLVGDPEASRPYFRLTRRVFEGLAALRLDGVTMTVLSMGMSDSYRIAIEEGATLVRIGTALFGPRPACRI